VSNSQLEADIGRLAGSLGQLPEPTVTPALVVVSGLPGTGKSSFSRRLAQRLPFLILESDALRKTLFNPPDYSLAESGRLFRACHLIIQRLLERGIPVIFDATNLSEKHRERLYSIADHLGARLVLVRVEAPAGVVHERLGARQRGAAPPTNSDADWGVYQRMRPSVDKICRKHYAVDTSRDITPVLGKIVREVGR
jgi:predicted kinase